MSEPVYQYIKGQGWVPSFVRHLSSAIREHEGRRYQVIVLDEPAQRGDRSARNYENASTLNWWPEYTFSEGLCVPAGFGPATAGGKDYVKKVLTIPL